MAYTTFTYAGLRTALQNYLEDDFTDFAGSLDLMIGQAELRLLRDLDLTIFDVTDITQQTTIGVETISKPTDTITVLWIRCGDTLLEPRASDWMEDYLVDADRAPPRFYAEVSDTQLRVAPVPDRAYALTYRINRRPVGLSADQSTTWLSTNVGDLLFAAAKCQAEYFVRDFEAANVWEQEYQQGLVNARAEFKDIVRRQYRPMLKQPQALPGPHNRATG